MTFPRTALLFCLILPAACTSVPIGTMWQMRNVDPLTVDPADVRIAVRLPAAYGVQKNGVSLVFGMERPQAGQDEPERIEETYVLETSATITSPFLRERKKEGFHLLTFWLEQADYNSMRTMQRTMKRWKQEGKATGSLSVNTKPCVNSTPDDDRLLVSTYIRLDPDQDFMTLTRDMDFARQTDMEEMLASLPDCAGE